ncbi:MAG: TIGR03905 family TSCPD domain-containing protein [Oscillospiraceae bacterium]|nr:TIGR03905 family TSCPD domain-containing protein [Oscillospiraceae bacterium]
MTHTYPTRGICPRRILVELDGETITRVHFEGGCDGNLTGIAKLVQGMNAHDVIAKFAGTRCGPRATSCPDQLSQALEQALNAQK